MRRKYFKLLFLLLLCLSLISCGKKEPSPKDDLTLVLPDGKSITLYMDREEVEKIIGEPTKKPDHGVYSYETFSIAYTENKLSFIFFDANSGEGCKTKSDISINTDLAILNAKGFELNKGEVYRKYFSYSNNTFSVSEKTENVNTLFTNVVLEIPTSENKIRYIVITDDLVGNTAQFDK